MKLLTLRPPVLSGLRVSGTRRVTTRASKVAAMEPRSIRSRRHPSTSQDPFQLNWPGGIQNVTPHSALRSWYSLGSPIPFSPSFRRAMPDAAASSIATCPIKNMRAFTPVAPPLDSSHSSAVKMSRSIASRMGTPRSETALVASATTRMRTEGTSVSIQLAAQYETLAATSSFLRESRSATTPRKGKRNACKAWIGHAVRARTASEMPTSLAT
mmetsp:Transcript_6659/g.17974  ORF Transcript_6659/g.17974 Transcript_6659/m.17974 type:complete len:213 (+) Transcript_6659:264-902(+)